MLDPLDGTKNFLHGLPVYASSVGVLYRGEPVIGAVYTPWPNASGGVVHHARRGGGAYTDGVPIAVAPLEAPHSGQLATIPGSFDWLYQFSKSVRGSTGDPRVTGSIAYELILVARGVTQYMFTSNPHLVGRGGRRSGGDGGRLGADGRRTERGAYRSVPAYELARVERAVRRLAVGSDYDEGVARMGAPAGSGQSGGGEADCGEHRMAAESASVGANVVAEATEALI